MAYNTKYMNICSYIYIYQSNNKYTDCKRKTNLDFLAVILSRQKTVLFLSFIQMRTTLFYTVAYSQGMCFILKYVQVIVTQ